MGKTLAFVPLLLALLAVACGSDAASTLVATPAATPPPTAASIAGGVNVDIKDFTHQDLSIPVGTTVVWTNRDNVRHTTTGEGGKWDSGPLETSDLFSF
ncbi:MAG: hypothetical protein IH956_00785, partial [Chloroflexi bacterium]|nr:hypothetical protein [Chloroflexota bacterium]